MARVNSYITKGKGTYHGADKDLREEELDEVAKDKESGLPKKYVSGLSLSTAKARAAHWDKMDKLSDKDPAAYEPAPGDATAKTKESKHTKKYREMFGEACWTGYKRVGMKKKGDKMVPNCVPEEVERIDELSKTTLRKYDSAASDQVSDIDHSLKRTQNSKHFSQSTKDELKKLSDRRKKGIRLASDKRGYYKGSDHSKNFSHGSAKVHATEEVELDEMSKLSDALAKIKHDFENPPADHKDAKPAPAKKPEPKKGGGMPYYPDSRGGRRYMGDSVEMDGETIKEASPKAGKNVVPPTAGTIGSIGGLVREEENENKPLGKVMRAGDGKKKFKVFVKNSKGNVVKVGFGDPNMEIKRDDPERRKNFRARHNCDTATDRTTPRYWSCRQWRSSAKVEA
jgi:hypothetical protein